MGYRIAGKEKKKKTHYKSSGVDICNLVCVSQFISMSMEAGQAWTYLFGDACTCPKSDGDLASLAAPAKTQAANYLRQWSVLGTNIQSDNNNGVNHLYLLSNLDNVIPPN